MPKRPRLNASQSSNENSPPPTPPPSPPPPPPEAPTLRPELNLNAVERGHPIAPLPLPSGLFNFNTNDESSIESRQNGKPPFFPNAQAARRLEEGFIEAEGYLKMGQSGLYVEDDGAEIMVTVQQEAHNEIVDGKYRFVYTLVAANGKRIKPIVRQRHYEWNFYLPTAPVPFVPGPREQPFANGGKRKTRKRKAKRSKTRSKVKRA